MVYSLKKVFKILAYGLIAFAAFAISFLTGGMREYKITKGLVIGTSVAHADAPPGAVSSGDSGTVYFTYGDSSGYADSGEDADSAAGDEGESGGDSGGGGGDSG